MPRKHRVNDLRHNGVVVPDDARENDAVTLFAQSRRSRFSRNSSFTRRVRNLSSEKVAAAQVTQRARNTHERNPPRTTMSVIIRPLSLTDPALSGSSEDSMRRSITAFLARQVLALGTLLMIGGTLLPAKASDQSQGTDLPWAGQIGEVSLRLHHGQSYVLYIPSGYTAAKRWPIVYFFDPAGRGRRPSSSYIRTSRKNMDLSLPDRTIRAIFRVINRQA